MGNGFNFCVGDIGDEVGVTVVGDRISVVSGQWSVISVSVNQIDEPKTGNPITEN